MSAPIVVFAVFGIVLLVLAIAGASKVANPVPTAQTLATIGIDVGPGPVRVLGAVEIVLAAATAITANPILIGVTAALHLGFTAVVFAVRQAHRRALTAGADNPLGGCGCFGNASAPPGAGHVAFTIGSAALGAVAATSVISPTALFGQGVTNSLLTVALIVLGAFLEILILTELPELFASFEPQPEPPAKLSLR